MLITALRGLLLAIILFVSTPAAAAPPESTEGLLTTLQRMVVSRRFFDPGFYIGVSLREEFGAEVKPVFSRNGRRQNISEFEVTDFPFAPTAANSPRITLWAAFQGEGVGVFSVKVEWASGHGPLIDDVERLFDPPQSARLPIKLFVRDGDEIHYAYPGQNVHLYFDPENGRVSRMGFASSAKLVSVERPR